jgi:ABC transporter substrate binding protein
MSTRCRWEWQFGGQVVHRRSVLAGGAALTAAALTTPRVTRAQPAERRRRVGWLSGTEGVRPTLSDALRELGWIEGRNIGFETRNAEGQRERMAPMAMDLVAAKVELIIAMAPGAIRAAMQATNEIPIVMAWWGGPDLVEAGLITSYARPGGMSQAWTCCSRRSTPSDSTCCTKPCRRRRRSPF